MAFRLWLTRIRVLRGPSVYDGEGSAVRSSDTSGTISSTPPSHEARLLLEVVTLLAEVTQEHYFGRELPLNTKHRLLRQSPRCLQRNRSDRTMQRTGPALNAVRLYAQHCDFTYGTNYWRDQYLLEWWDCSVQPVVYPNEVYNSYNFWGDWETGAG